MNYCTKCQSHYQQPGTCNCFAPVQTWVTSYFAVACPGCGKFVCDRSHTACPPPVTTVTTVWPPPNHTGTAYYTCPPIVGPTVSPPFSVLNINGTNAMIPMPYKVPS